MILLPAPAPFIGGLFERQMHDAGYVSEVRADVPLAYYRLGEASGATEQVGAGSTGTATATLAASNSWSGFTVELVPA